ncbi:MAG: exonuclease domain-containing protein [bacterium]|nr:exonuclease domain-containing protein [bacterium]
MTAPHRQLRSFAAIDFETATAKRSSACALGLVIVDSGRIVDEQSWLIRPPGNEYHSFNSRLHGISASDTEDAASFDQIWSEAAAIAQDRLLVAHNAAFDISVLMRSAAYHGYTHPEASYLCTYRLARSRWPDRYSWKLPDVCEALGIDDLDHHDPLSDARAAAKVLLAMCEQDECEIEDLCQRLGYQPGIFAAVSYSTFSNAARGQDSPGARISLVEPTTRSMDSDGLLFGKRVAFTGTLASMTRKEAFQVTVNSGGEPSTSVSRRTDLLVVGITDFATVGTGGMSSKMRKAVELANSGAMIEIIDEGDFLRLAAGEAVNPLGGTIEAVDNDGGP